MAADTNFLDILALLSGQPVNADPPPKTYKGRPVSTNIENRLPPEPSIMDVFLQDLQSAPGRLYDQFVGQPLTALDVLGTAITTPDKVPVTEDEFLQQMIQKGELEQASDVLGGMVGVSGAGLASAARPDPNVLNVFAGPRSLTADHEKLIEALSLAKQMKFGEELSTTGSSTLRGNPQIINDMSTTTQLAKGLTSDQINEIFETTGWFPGADNKWRYEIPDTPRIRAGVPNIHDNYIEALAFEKSLGTPSPMAEALSALQTTRSRLGDLDQFLEHPDLYGAYPEIAKLRAKVTGRASAQQGVNYVGGKSREGANIEAMGWTPEDITSVLLHEVQHEIQTKERFASGGNPEAMGHSLASLVPNAEEQLLYPTPYEMYRALMGEVEAHTINGRYEGGTAPSANFPLPGSLAPSLPFGKGTFSEKAFAALPMEHQFDPRWFDAPSLQPEVQGMPLRELSQIAKTPGDVTNYSKNLLKDKLKAYAAYLRGEQPMNKAAQK